MQVSCPSCGTKYMFPRQEARPEVKARCKRCGVVFSVKLGKEPGQVSSEPVKISASLASSKPRTPESPLDMSAKQPSAPPPPANEPFAPATGEKGSVAPSDAPNDERDGAFGQGIWHPSEPSRPAGVSAIRAQGMRSEGSLLPTTSPADAKKEPEDQRSGWLVRREEGGTRSFRDLESVRAWMTANPGSEVLISSNGIDWRSPDEVAGLTTASPGQLGARAVNVAAPALGATSSKPRSNGERAGLAWTLAAMSSSLLLFFAGALTAQNLGLFDFDGIIPFEDLGVQGLLWAPAGASLGEQTELLEEARYRAAVGEGDAAREGGRLFDAITSYGRALEVLEGSEALEGLVASYEALGDSERAGETRRRLTGLKETGPNDDE